MSESATQRIRRESDYAGRVSPAGAEARRIETDDALEPSEDRVLERSRGCVLVR